MSSKPRTRRRLAGLAIIAFAMLALSVSAADGQAQCDRHADCHSAHDETRPAYDVLIGNFEAGLPEHPHRAGRTSRPRLSRTSVDDATAGR